MTPTRYPALEGPTSAVRRLLATLLDQNVVDGVLVQMSQSKGHHLTHALVTDSDVLLQANPLAPSMPVNAARLISKLSSESGKERIAAVIRPCEERALAELVKLRQASLDRIYLVVLDCAGAVAQGELERLSAGPDELDGAVAIMYGSAHEPDAPGPKILPGCKLCVDFVPGQLADISLEFFGHPDWIGVGLSQRLSEKIDLTALGIEPSTDDNAHENRVSALKEERQRSLDKTLENMARLEDGVEGLLEMVSGCIRCGNCQRVCPICFCRRCTFEMPAFEHDQAHFLRSAKRGGATRLPEDVLLYHMTRLAHVALSCARCGACEVACPQDIPLTSLFAHVSKHVRRPFDYNPGKSLDDPLPLSTFEQEELEPR